MNVVGIIPARAGSKRLPQKNLAMLAGRPLLAHTCDAACTSGIFSAVYINTDCSEIAAAAKRSGVSCPILRPAALAADDTPTRDAMLFLLHWLADRGERYDAVAILQPTSPLRTAEDIRAAWRMFEDDHPCAVVSVSPVAPAHWIGPIGRDGRFERGTGDDTVCRLNGAIYIYTWEDYLSGREPRRTRAYVMPATRGVDVDTQTDLDYADFLLSQQPAAV